MDENADERKTQCLRCKKVFFEINLFQEHLLAQDCEVLLPSLVIPANPSVLEPLIMPSTAVVDPGTRDVFSVSKHRCLKCSLGFLTTDGLLAHVKTDEHKNAPSSPQIPSNLPPVFQPEEIKDIKQAAHDPETPKLDSYGYKCLKCSLGFPAKEGLMEHLTSDKHKNIFPPTPNPIKPPASVLEPQHPKEDAQIKQHKNKPNNVKPVAQQQMLEFFPSSEQSNVNFEAMVRRIVREELASVVQDELVKVFSAYCSTPEPNPKTHDSSGNIQPLIKYQEQKNPSDNRYTQNSYKNTNRRGDVRL